MWYYRILSAAAGSLSNGSLPYFICTHKAKGEGLLLQPVPLWDLGCRGLSLPLTLAFITWSIHWSLKLQVGVSGVSCDTMAKACLLLFVCFVSSTKNWTRHRVVIVKRWIYYKWAMQYLPKTRSGSSKPWSPAPEVFLYRREKEKSLEGMDLVLTACVFFVYWKRSVSTFEWSWLLGPWAGFLRAHSHACLTLSFCLARKALCDVLLVLLTVCIPHFCVSSIKL